MKANHRNTPKSKRERKRNQRTALLLVGICLMIVCGLLLLNRWERQTVFLPEESMDQTVPGQITYQDRVYVPKRHIENILIVGLDKYQAQETSQGYLNDQQSDFLMLLVLDHDRQRCDILHLNRDTMTEIRRLGIGGGVAGTFTGQLALAHTFGSGGSDSCLNTVEAVSDLLKGVYIDHYVTMTMDAVAKLNDMLGGIQVEVMDDLTAVDPELVKGERVRLTGDQALTYVRARGGLEDSSNLHRMERQRQYVSALLEKMRQRSAAGQPITAKEFLEISQYVQSDLTVTQMEHLSTDLAEITFAPITTIDGKAVKGKEFMEFYVDEAALERTVMSLFYQQKAK